MKNTHNFLALTLERVVIFAFSYYSSSIMIGYLGAETFVVYNQYLSLFQIIGMCALTGTGSILVKLYMHSGFNRIFLSILKLRYMAIATLILGYAIICIVNVEIELSLLIVTCFIVELLRFQALIYPYWESIQKPYISSYVRIVVISFTSALRILMVLYQYDVEYFLFLFLLEIFLLSIFHFMIFRTKKVILNFRQIRLLPSEEEMEIYGRTSYLFISSIFIIFFQKIDAFFLPIFLPDLDVGNYLALFRYLELTNSAMVVLLAVTFPLLLKKDITTIRFSLLSILCSFLIAVFLYASFDVITDILYKELELRMTAYYGEIKIGIVVASFFTGARLMLSKVIIDADIYRYSLISHMGALTSYLFLISILVNHFQIVGVLISYNVAMLLSCSIVLYGKLKNENNTQKHS